jgi:hypothetical protein
LVLGPLKLALKYQADVLRDRIVNHLSNDCPTTLEGWDKVAYPTELDDSDPMDEPSNQSWFNTPDYLAKDFFSADPSSYLMLARSCDLPVVFATLLYSLCTDSMTRKGKLSRMTRGDMETLFLGKDRMMSWISGPAVDELKIESWIQVEEGNFCSGRSCQIPLFKVWSRLLQDVMRYGDPLGTFRATALRYQIQDQAGDDDHDYEYDYRGRDEVCCWCKDRIAEKLFDLRQNLFDQLPSFFPLRVIQVDPQETTEDWDV